jgi:hypothetical protein
MVNARAEIGWLLWVSSCIAWIVSCDATKPATDAAPMSEAEAGLPDVGPGDPTDASLADAGSDAADGDAQTQGGDAGVTPPCMSTAPTSCPEPAPGYGDVAPIFEQRCVVCHDGSDGEWPLSTYQHVADWYGEIRAMMLSCGMPPADSGMTMELEERQRILTWIRCGFPR